MSYLNPSHFNNFFFTNQPSKHFFCGGYSAQQSIFSGCGVGGMMFALGSLFAGIFAMSRASAPQQQFTYYQAPVHQPQALTSVPDKECETRTIAALPDQAELQRQADSNFVSGINHEHGTNFETRAEAQEYLSGLRTQVQQRENPPNPPASAVVPSTSSTPPTPPPAPAQQENQPNPLATEQSHIPVTVTGSLTFGDGTGYGSGSDMTSYNRDSIGGRTISRMLEIAAEDGDVYSAFTDTLREHKDSPEAIRSIVDATLAKFVEHYDSNMPHDKVAGSQEEIMSKILRAAPGEDVTNNICGPIHGFMQQALADVGIEAAVVTGKTDAGEGHATLMYKVGEGKYVFNDYGDSVLVEADNILEAVKTVHKEHSTRNTSDGFVQLTDINGSFQQYALENVAAYGSEVDKYNKILDGMFDKRKASEPQGIFVNGSGDITQKDFQVQLGYNSEHWGIGGQVVGTSESEVGYRGISAGTRVWAGNTFNLNDGTDLTLSGHGIYSYTRLEIGDEEKGTDAINNFHTFAGGVDITLDHNLVDGDHDGLDFRAEVSATGSGVLSNIDDNEGFFTGDGQINAGIGLNYTRWFNNGATLNLNGGIRGIGAFSQDFNTWKPALTPGVQAFAGASFETNNEYGFNTHISASGAFMQDATQQQARADMNINGSYTNQAGNTVSAGLFAGYGMQRIFAGSFDETITNDVTWGINAQADLTQNVSLFANMSQTNSLGQPFVWDPKFCIGTRLTF